MWWGCLFFEWYGNECYSLPVYLTQPAFSGFQSFLIKFSAKKERLLPTTYFISINFHLKNWCSSLSVGSIDSWNLVRRNAAGVVMKISTNWAVQKLWLFFPGFLSPVWVLWCSILLHHSLIHRKNQATLSNQLLLLLLNEWIFEKAEFLKQERFLETFLWGNVYELLQGLTWNKNILIEKISSIGFNISIFVSNVNVADANTVNMIMSSGNQPSKLK